MPKIVISKPDGDPVVVQNKPFDLEAVLQENIKRLPEVIPLEDALGQPVALLPIGMEVQVGSGAIDVLMVDSSGVVTIVETKLAKNPESRREVVGQVLEYAAHVSEWSLEDIERAAKRFFDDPEKAPPDYKGQTLRSAVEQFLETAGEEVLETEEYLARISDNLRGGRLRLIVASDQLLEVALKTISFVNAHSSFDMLLLQLTCYEDEEGMSIYVPSLHGYTRKIVNNRPPKWTEDRFFEHLATTNDEATIDYTREIYGFFAKWTAEAYWGWGTTFGSVNLVVRLESQTINVAQITSRGDLYINFRNFFSRDLSGEAEALATELSNIQGVQFAASELQRRSPPIPRPALRDDDRRAAILSAIRQSVERLRGE